MNSTITVWNASHKWIASMFWSAAANRMVVDNLTNRINATGTRAGIYAFLIRTGLIQLTLRTGNTFWTARGWAAYETWYARANTLSIYLPT